LIDYIIILLAVFCFAGQFAFTKTYEGTVRQTTVTSLVMLVVTSLIGTVLYLFVGGFRVEFSSISVFWAVLFALVMIPYYMIGIKVLSLGSLAVYSMFMMLGGMLVPFFYGVWFLQESVSAAQILGTVLLTGFIILQAISQSDFKQASKEKQSAKTKITFFVLCLVIFILNGLTGVIAKAHQISESSVDEVSFTVISCALTAIFSMILLAFEFLRNRKEKSRQVMMTLKIKPLCSMALIGVSAYTGNFLHLLAANNVPASVQFPLVSGGVIVLSALVSAFVFKEKISKKEWLSIAGSFVSTVLFAF
jgi:drug/metabolite transporter (DMT)-like permease